MKKVLLLGLFSFLVSCQEASHDPVPPGNGQRKAENGGEEVKVSSRVKGYAVVNANVKRRIFKDPNRNLADYLSNESNPFGGNALTQLLGSHSNNGTSDFANPNPNPVNSLIWHLVFDGLSKDLSSLCSENDSENESALQEHVAEAVHDFCISQMFKDKPSKEALLDYWLNIMNYDAPITEFTAWQEFVLSSELEELTPEEFVWAINLAIFYNPYFLIKSE